MLDPKMPKLSQLPLGQRVGKSLRPLLTASKRNMSTGTFYKTMKVLSILITASITSIGLSMWVLLGSPPTNTQAIEAAAA